MQMFVNCKFPMSDHTLIMLEEWSVMYLFTKNCQNYHLLKTNSTKKMQDPALGQMAHLPNPNSRQLEDNTIHLNVIASQSRINLIGKLKIVIILEPSFVRFISQQSFSYITW